MSNDEIYRGDIYWVNFAPSVGHEYQGRRPAVIIQSNKSLNRTNLVTVLPLTSQLNKLHKDDILITANKTNNLYGDSLVKVHHIESFDRSRFIKPIGKLDNATMDKIKIYLKEHFDL